jgi:signal transduction histidine kinase
MVATALELYAELVGHALANVRLRRERVERERLAALGEASAVMAHEVRNPVGAILNAVAIARRTPAGDPVQAEMLRIIAEEAGRLEHLIGQLLEIGRPLAPRPRLTTLDELVATSLALLVSRQECSAGRVEVRPAVTPTPVALDPDLACLALLNVLRNAVQSTPKSGAIQVGFARQSSMVAIVVEDEGPGLPAEVLQRLGEPFTTTRATGTGIGLAVVRRVLEASRGRLEIRASALGGARVELWFAVPSLSDASPGSA